MGDYHHEPVARIISERLRQFTQDQVRQKCHHGDRRWTGSGQEVPPLAEELLAISDCEKIETWF